MDPRQQLKQCPLFAELDEREIDALEAIVTFRKIGRGSMLFFEGDAATGFFILLSGGVRIYKSSPEGKEYTLHRIRPGQMFAEAAIFRGKGFPANCIATDDSEVAYFPKLQFVELLGRSPQIALKIIGSLSNWLREFTKKLEELSLKEVPARVAFYLLRRMDQVDSHTIELDINKSELATQLGTIPETLSRTFRKLREADLIAMDGKKITVLDEAGLRSVAHGEKV
ncbi:cyclic nucleotide-binding domain-containing protein [candidate division GN15 bacterium]|nr:cyclic nucleotide-binding domain-containing protein [candidate division GN15 bacterium]